MKKYTLLLMIMPVFLFGQIAENFEIKFKAKITQRAKMADDVHMEDLPFMLRNYLDPINQNLQYHYKMENEEITYIEQKYLSRDDGDDWMDLTHKAIIENGIRTIYNSEGVALDTFDLDEEELNALSAADVAMDFLIRQEEFPVPGQDVYVELQNNGIEVIEHTPDFLELKFSSQSSMYFDKQDLSVTTIDILEGKRYINQSQFAYFENIGFLKTAMREITYLSAQVYIVKTEERYGFEMDDESLNASVQPDIQSKFFPNPADNMYTIYLDDSSVGIESVVMTELYTGATYTFNGNQNPQLTLYINNVAAGYYSVAMQLNNGSTIFKTIIIN